MTNRPEETKTRRLLGTLYLLENVIHSLPGDRRAAAIDLVTERVRRLRKRHSAPATLSDPGSAQIDLDEFLNGCRPCPLGQARRKKTSDSGGRPGGAAAK